MNKKKKKGLIIFTVIVLLSAFIYNLSDLNKARISLQVLGINNENKTNFPQIKDIILNNNYVRINNFYGISSYYNNLILNEFYPNRDSTINISSLFAKSDEEWNSGCQPSPIKPNMKFESLLISDKYLILIYKSGGFVISYNFAFYEVHSNYLKEISQTSILGQSIFDLALELRINKNLTNFTSYNKRVYSFSVKEHSINHIIGKWEVVESNFLPFNHISDCNNLGLRSKFIFTKLGILKVFRENENIKCNQEQVYTIDSNKIAIFESDFTFFYDILKINNDTLQLRNNWLYPYVNEESEDVMNGKTINQFEIDTSLILTMKKINID